MAQLVPPPMAETYYLLPSFGYSLVRSYERLWNCLYLLATFQRSSWRGRYLRGRGCGLWRCGGFRQKQAAVVEDRLFLMSG